MDTSQFDSKIALIRKEMESHAGRMDFLLASFVEQAKRFLSDFSTATIKEAVMSDPERSKKLGPDKIKEIKSELGDLVRDLPGLVEKEFGAARFSAKQAMADGKLAELLGTHKQKVNIPECVDASLRRFMGRSAVILNRYDLLEKRSVYWEFSGANSCRYAIAINLPSDAEAIMKEYCDYYMKLNKNNDQMRVYEKEKAEFEVKHMWDNS